MLRVLWVLTVCLAACVSPEQIECGDGTICPADYTCTSFGCASADQMAACNGVAADEECSIDRGVGVCLEGACFVAVCGNGVTEPTEACDDGNAANNDGCNSKCTSTEVCGNAIVELDEECDSTDAECNGVTCKFRRCGDGVKDVEIGELCDDDNIVGGDGCSPDCRSLELCSNGTLDYFAGETCEDSNLRGLDGCSTTCQVEVGLWQQVRQGAAPAQTLQMGMTFDSNRRVWVMFGGLTVVDNAFEVSDQTWETNGTTWTQRLLNSSVPRVVNHMMAYDPVRERVVMFGGQVIYGGAPVGETWEYDSARWTRILPANAPAPRVSGTLAFDAKRKRLVLFGGNALVNNALVYMNDTWVFDGQTWSALTTNTPPPARFGAAMAYDAKAGRMVLYGGMGESGELQDTWFLDGATWTSSSATVGPRVYSSMAYDSDTGHVVMFSGRTGSSDITDMHELIDSTWTPRTSGTMPAGRAGHALVSDPTTGTLLLFGGINANGPSNATFRVDGTTFTPVVPHAPPPGGADGAMAYDSRRGRTVLLTPVNNTDAETWTFDGSAWALLATDGVDPDLHRHHAMAYEPELDRIVVFGGNGSPDGNHLATFELQGSTWTKIDTATQPPGRLWPAMAYDPIRKRIVMYGGLGESPGGPLNDTWEYYGGNWHLVTTANTPPIRDESAMAFDASRGKIVLFGGDNSLGYTLDETWEYDGTNWQPVVTSAAPPARRAHALVYDAGRGHVVLFGGQDAGGIAINDLWELDGATWREIPRNVAYPPPPSRSYHDMVYDTAHRQIVVTAGISNTLDGRSDTWTFEYATTDAVESCTTDRDLDGDTKGGCADDDCWGVCAPLCSPQSLASTCPANFARCGDGTCDPVENCRNCATDCPLGTTACPTRCGDGYCELSESLASCPGDCTP